MDLPRIVCLAAPYCTAGYRRATDRIPAGAPHAECSEYQRVALRQGYPAASQWHTSDAQIPLELETVARDYHDLDAECIHHRYVVRNRRENRILDRLPSERGAPQSATCCGAYVCVVRACI